MFGVQAVQVQGRKRQAGLSNVKGATSGAGTRVLVLNVDGLLRQSLV